MTAERFFVVRKQWKDMIPHRTGNYPDYFDRQYLIRKYDYTYTTWFGISWIQRKTETVDCEDVPIWASAELACTGSTSWQSKFAEYIKEEQLGDSDE